MKFHENPSGLGVAVFHVDGQTGLVLSRPTVDMRCASKPKLFVNIANALLCLDMLQAWILCVDSDGLLRCQLVGESYLPNKTALFLRSLEPYPGIVLS